MAGIQVNDAASIMTEVTTIFLGDQDDQDDRYVILRADRKEISKCMNNFIVERKALMAVTQKQCDEDFEIEARYIDSDQARVYLAMNTTAWVQSAHNTLDAYNDYDREMLGKMADYVEKCRVIMCSAPFFATQSDETSRKAVFLTREDIVPSRKDEKIEKRRRVEDSDESVKPAKARAMDKSAAYTSDTSNENTSEIQVAPMGVSARNPTRRMLHAVARKREREASLSSLPNQPQTVPKGPAAPTIDQAVAEDYLA